MAFLQRTSLAFAGSAGLAVVFFAGGIAAGSIPRGLRAHGLPVLLLGALGARLLWRRSRATRREAVVDLLADARALVLDRGMQEEVRRVLRDLDLRLDEPPVDVQR